MRLTCVPACGGDLGFRGQFSLTEVISDSGVGLAQGALLTSWDVLINKGRLTVSSANWWGERARWFVYMKGSDMTAQVLGSWNDFLPLVDLDSEVVLNGKPHLLLKRMDIILVKLHLFRQEAFTVFLTMEMTI